KKMIEVVEGRGDIVGPMVRGPWSLPDDELMKRPGYKGVTAQDVEKAKALLAEAGYPRGFSAEIMSNNIYTNQATLVQSQLKSIGLDVTIKMLDTPTLERRFLAKDFSLSLYLPGHPIDEPDLFLSFWVTGGGRNYGGVSDKEVDLLYEQQSREMDVAKRKDLVLRAQRKILDLAGSPVLYHHLYETAYWKCVKGYYPEKRIAGHNDVKRQDVWLDDGCR
ncbi:MAG: ABC transporter substrate-binding protein, partial [Chloroflexota bacterium]|nr:ABC transporter substrate-binding protein [Chloroflexota bacterium]